MAGHICIIVNPVSGASGRSALARSAAAGLARCGFDAAICPTTCCGDATRLAHDAAGRGAAAVVVVGGDGTVREAAVGLAGSQTALAIVPGGTENLVAKHFGFRADAAAVVEMLRSGRTMTIDVAHARIDGTERPFLVVAGLGFDAEVVQRLAAARNGHITHTHYVLPIWRAFWRHRFPHLRVEADGKLVCDEPGLVFVGNIPRYAMKLPILCRAQPDDALLDLCVYRCTGRGRLLRHAIRTILGRHIGSAGVTYQQAREIRVRSNEHVPIELDGDPAGCLMQGRDQSSEAVFRIEPRALRVAVPAH